MKFLSRIVLAKFAIIFCLLATLFISFPVVQAEDQPGGPSKSDPQPGGPSTPPATQTQNGFPKLENPLGDNNIGSLQDFVIKAIDMIFKILLPIAAMFIIYAGFEMVMASGNEEKLKTAKQQLLYTLLGVLIILGAWVIANAIAGTVDSIVKTS